MTTQEKLNQSLARIREKDAEIERLKAENNSLRLDAVENRQLITELADALEKIDPVEIEVRPFALIQRAREATK